MTKPRTTISWGPKSPKALVYDPLKPGEVTEEAASEDNSEWFPCVCEFRSDAYGRGDKQLRGSATEVAQPGPRLRRPREATRLHLYLAT